jgi:hypothetical protein
LSFFLWLNVAVCRWYEKKEPLPFVCSEVRTMESVLMFLAVAAAFMAGGVISQILARRGLPRPSRFPDGGAGARSTEITLGYTPEIAERIERIRKTVAATDTADVFRRSLAVYDFVVSQSGQGATFFLRRPDGQEVSVLVP